MMTSPHDVNDVGCTLSFPCNIQIVRKTQGLLAKHLERFEMKSKLKKQNKKSIGAFEKHASNVTSGGPILPKILEVVRK